jgi:signal transduction histidine kinase
LILCRGGQETGGFVVQPVVGRLCRSLSKSQTLAAEKRALATALDLKNAALQLTIQADNRLLSGVSHDLRTPLNTIVGYSLLLKTGFMEPEMQRTLESYATYIHDSGQHLSSLIEEIIEILARDETAREPGENLIDLHALLKSIRRCSKHPWLAPA